MEEKTGCFSLFKRLNNPYYVLRTMNHVFLVVYCKTPGCITARILKYMGPDSGEREFSEFVPTRFYVDCGRCLQCHSYEQSEVYPLITETAAPPEFHNAF